MGEVNKYTVMNPANIGSYSNIDHKLDREFRNSDKVLHQVDYPNTAAYNMPFGSLGSPVPKRSGPVGWWSK
jgi:hypothetical protein